MIRFLVCLLVPCLAPTAACASGVIHKVHYDGSDKPGELVFAVDYYLWVPDGVGTLRGVIVHQHGCGTGACQGGVTAAQDLHWQALARKWDCALMGSSYQAPDGTNCRLWCDPRNGSEQTFLRSLADFASATQHAELTQVPWCLWGHSGGGFWASLMHVKYPERIVAIWLRSGTGFSAWESGEIPRPEIPAAAYDVPVMGNPGLKEKSDPRFRRAWDGLLAMLEAYRAHGAPLGFAPDPRTSHECGDSRYLAIRFFDTCLAQRLSEKGAKDQTLRPLDRSRAWLATPTGDDLQPQAAFSGDPAKAAWLPDEAFATAWSEYIRTGSVDDATPPPPPTQVTVTVKPGEGIELTWEAEADLESGIQAFLIERNGQPLAQVPEKPVGRFGRPLFQAMSYHDTPEAPVPEMRFMDRTAQPGDKPVYRVFTVNSVGLKSEPRQGPK
jgi:pimeloyl-ACP methyl ester carboxylesterase